MLLIIGRWAAWGPCVLALLYYYLIIIFYVKAGKNNGGVEIIRCDDSVSLKVVECQWIWRQDVVARRGRATIEVEDEDTTVLYIYILAVYH